MISGTVKGLSTNSESFFVKLATVDEIIKKGPTSGALVRDVVISKDVSMGVVIHPTLITSGLLVYPAKGGRNEMQLKFSVPKNIQNLYMKHTHAEELCRKLNLRLPTARELFDYCSAGSSPTNPSSDASTEQQHRCSLPVWSASTIAGASNMAFISIGGALRAEYRTNTVTTMCVGNP